jgi:shikimate dehydrogenase
MICGSTKICMILGYPLKHTRSPVMHNAAFTALGLDYIYIPLEVKPKGLSALIQTFREMENFGGANVTVPYKVQVMQYLDGWSQEAEAIGAVNTLYKKGKELRGENTDGRGFLASLREEAGFEPRGKQVMLLGAGGAARALAQALVREGATRIYLVNRTLQKAEELASSLNGKTGRSSVAAIGFEDPLFPHRLQECRLLVNATSVGLCSEDPPLFDYRLLSSMMLVYDLIYDPDLTPLLRAAQERGCRVLNGLGMLVFQGALSFEIWTQRRPPVEKMREAVKVTR